MKSPELTIDQISIGDTTSFEHTFTEADVQTFATLSGDYNPLHMDPSYAEKTIFGRRIVHGLLVASLASRFVGMYIPGRRCLYLSQTLNFKKPVYIGDTVSVAGIVTYTSLSTNIVEIDIVITKPDRVTVLDGKAIVKVI